MIGFRPAENHGCRFVPLLNAAIGVQSNQERGNGIQEDLAILMSLVLRASTSPPSSSRFHQPTRTKEQGGDHTNKQHSSKYCLQS